MNKQAITDIQYHADILPAELQKQWDGICHRVFRTEKVRIANTGLMSSGKSSFFNALLGCDKSTPRFAVGAAKVTVTQDIEALNDKIELVDTPGIDADEHDTEEALNAVMEADVIVMIHNIKMGALRAEEYAWLRSIAGRMRTVEEKKARLVFLCSWIDERDTSEDFSHTIEETQRMVFEAVGCEIDFYQISVKRYQAGVEKEKTALVDKSNVPMVKDALIAKAEAYMTASERLIAAELIHLCNDSIDKLEEKQEGLEEKRATILERIKEKFEQKHSAWKSALNNFRSQYGIVQQKKREMDSI